MDKVFRLHRPVPQHADYSLGRAIALGWDDGDEGYAALDTLAVGQTTVDDDGDVWERTA